MTRAPRAALATTALAIIASAASACAPAMKLPAGPGTPSPDSQQAFAEATAACRAVSTISFEAAVTGSIDGRRIPRSRLLVGLAAPSSARIEAPAAFGAPLFVLVARDGDATLLLERDRRVLEHGRPDAVLEALAGVPLGPSGLRTTLTGCPEAIDEIDRIDPLRARQLGDDWRMISQGTGVVYLHRASRGAAWELVAAVHETAREAQSTGGAVVTSVAPVVKYRAEYREFLNGLPRAVRLTSVDSNSFDLRLTLSQVEVNVLLEAGVFSVQVPSSTQPIDLDELRRSGPLGASRDSGR